MRKTTNVWLPDRDVRRRAKVGCEMGSVRVQALLFVCRGIISWLGKGSKYSTRAGGKDTHLQQGGTVAVIVHGVDVLVKEQLRHPDCQSPVLRVHRCQLIPHSLT
jgi:hypothetical protein